MADGVTGSPRTARRGGGGGRDAAEAGELKRGGYVSQRLTKFANAFEDGGSAVDKKKKAQQDVIDRFEGKPQRQRQQLSPQQQRPLRVTTPDATPARKRVLVSSPTSNVPTAPGRNRALAAAADAAARGSPPRPRALKNLVANFDDGGDAPPARGSLSPPGGRSAGKNHDAMPQKRRPVSAGVATGGVVGGSPRPSTGAAGGAAGSPRPGGVEKSRDAAGGSPASPTETKKPSAIAARFQAAALEAMEEERRVAAATKGRERDRALSHRSATGLPAASGRSDPAAAGLSVDRNRDVPTPKPGDIRAVFERAGSPSEGEQRASRRRQTSDASMAPSGEGLPGPLASVSTHTARGIAAQLDAQAARAATEREREQQRRDQHREAAALHRLQRASSHLSDLSVSDNTSVHRVASALSGGVTPDSLSTGRMVSSPILSDSPAPLRAQRLRLGANAPEGDVDKSLYTEYTATSLQDDSHDNGLDASRRGRRAVARSRSTSPADIERVSSVHNAFARFRSDEGGDAARKDADTLSLTTSDGFMGVESVVSQHVRERNVIPSLSLESRHQAAEEVDGSEAEGGREGENGCDGVEAPPDTSHPPHEDAPDSTALQEDASEPLVLQSTNVCGFPDSVDPAAVDADDLDALEEVLDAALAAGVITDDPPASALLSPDVDACDRSSSLMATLPADSAPAPMRHGATDGSTLGSFSLGAPEFEGAVTSMGADITLTASQHELHPLPAADKDTQDVELSTGANSGGSAGGEVDTFMREERSRAVVDALDVTSPAAAADCATTSPMEANACGHTSFAEVEGMHEDDVASCSVEDTRDEGADAASEVCSAAAPASTAAQLRAPSLSSSEHVIHPEEFDDDDDEHTLVQVEVRCDNASSNPGAAASVTEAEYGGGSESCGKKGRKGRRKKAKAAPCQAEPEGDAAEETAATPGRGMDDGDGEGVGEPLAASRGRSKRPRKAGSVQSAASSPVEEQAAGAEDEGVEDEGASPPRVRRPETTRRSRTDVADSPPAERMNCPQSAPEAPPREALASAPVRRAGTVRVRPVTKGATNAAPHGREARDDVPPPPRHPSRIEAGPAQESEGVAEAELLCEPSAPLTLQTTPLARSGGSEPSEYARYETWAFEHSKMPRARMSAKSQSIMSVASSDGPCFAEGAGGAPATPPPSPPRMDGGDWVASVGTPSAPPPTTTVPPPTAATFAARGAAPGAEPAPTAPVGAAATSVVDDLEELFAMHMKGTLSADEFSAAKRVLLGGALVAPCLQRSSTSLPLPPPPPRGDLARAPTAPLTTAAVRGGRPLTFSVRFRNRLMNFFHHYRPEKLPSVMPTIRHAGGEEPVMAALMARYGPEPTVEYMTLPLHDGWRQVESKEGDVFYRHRDGAKQWERPVAGWLPHSPAA